MSDVYEQFDDDFNEVMKEQRRELAIERVSFGAKCWRLLSRKSAIWTMIASVIGFGVGGTALYHSGYVDQANNEFIAESRGLMHGRRPAPTAFVRVQSVAPSRKPDAAEKIRMSKENQRKREREAEMKEEASGKEKFFWARWEKENSRLGKLKTTLEIFKKRLSSQSKRKEELTGQSKEELKFSWKERRAMKIQMTNLPAERASAAKSIPKIQERIDEVTEKLGDLRQIKDIYELMHDIERDDSRKQEKLRALKRDMIRDDASLQRFKELVDMERLEEMTKDVEEEDQGYENSDLPERCQCKIML